MAEPDDVSVWIVEDIPDADRLFLRVNARQLTGGVLAPAIFREQNGSMSTDWEKYSTPQESQSRARRPDVTGIVALVAGGVRRIPELRVRHSPDVAHRNRAHTDVFGIEQPHGLPPTVQKTRLRERLFDQFNTWLIPPSTWS